MNLRPDDIGSPVMDGLSTGIMPVVRPMFHRINSSAILNNSFRLFSSSMGMLPDTILQRHFTTIPITLSSLRRIGFGTSPRHRLNSVPDQKAWLAVFLSAVLILKTAVDGRE